MSYYSDCYYELHKDEFEKEKIAHGLKKRMIYELSSDDMIKIIFAEFIAKKSDYETIKIAEEYLNRDK